VVFKSVGIAVEDIAAAKLVYELVERRAGKIGH
jgi:ornithine cyclodeaminase/alanine dehydrogenase-like protein (mu-crystallin family)